MDKREELLEQGKKLREARETALQVKAGELLNIVQKCANVPIILSRSISIYSVEFNVKANGKNFGLDFSVRYSEHSKQVEISHSCGLSADDEYMKEVYPFIKERDRVIAKLWDYEEQIIRFFIEFRKIDSNFVDLICNVRNQLDELDYEEKKAKQDAVLKRLVVGSKWQTSVKSPYRRAYEVEKVTDKCVFMNDKRYNKNDFVNDVVNGRWEEAKEE